MRRIETADDPEAERAKLIKQMERESSPFPAARVGLLDDVIDPRDTRRYIVNKLEYLRKCKGNFISDKKLQSWPTGL